MLRLHSAPPPGGCEFGCSVKTGWRDARMARPALENLQHLLGYQFRQPELLLEALTHSSFVQEDSRRGRDNERLEFLGDAVLNFLVSVRLSEDFPDWKKENSPERGPAW
jgi:dsRNA-specific ribonuclease